MKRQHISLLSILITCPGAWTRHVHQVRDGAADMTLLTTPGQAHLATDQAQVEEKPLSRSLYVSEGPASPAPVYVNNYGKTDHSLPPASPVGRRDHQVRNTVWTIQTFLAFCTSAGTLGQTAS